MSIAERSSSEDVRLRHDAWAAALSMDALAARLSSLGATSVAFKLLPERQDNDKNQIYFGSDLTSGGATFLPSANLRGALTSSRRVGAAGKTLFQADVDFHWVTESGTARAPEAKLIFYPQYPEVRLSGLVKGCAEPPRTLYVRSLGAQVPGRILVLGVTSSGRTYGLLLPPEAPAAQALRSLSSTLERFGVLHLWELDGGEAVSADVLAGELHGVHLRGWVLGCRLTRKGIVPYFARPAGGATLEASLGVLTNAAAAPDFHGWELKQHSGNVLTLFTSEPDGGLYREDFNGFMWRHGVGKGERRDFTGIQRVGGAPHRVNGLSLQLRGFRTENDYDPDGAVELVDADGEVQASWSFVKLLGHWMDKHARAAYVPSTKNEALRAYRFGEVVRFAEGASFSLLLRALADGVVYYDPGCRASFDAKGQPIASGSKRRNQWRVKFQHLAALYQDVRRFDVTAVPPDNGRSSRALAELGVTLPPPVGEPVK